MKSRQERTGTITEPQVQLGPVALKSALHLRNGGRFVANRIK
jgi:hypothetical protein